MDFHPIQQTLLLGFYSELIFNNVCFKIFILDTFYSFEEICFIPTPVGTNVGEISLWEVSSLEKLASRNFQIWDIGESSMKLQVFFLLSLFN